jgi:protein ImuB
MTKRILCIAFPPPPSGDAARDLDDTARTHLAAECEEFSPVVGWLPGRDAPCLCMEIGATALWFGGEVALVERVAAWADERRPATTLAVADTPGAAWAAAHFATEGRASPTFVPVGETAAALAPLPVEALRLSPPTLALLAELGIDAIGTLASLPRVALAERFEPEVLVRLDQALGSATEVFAAFRPPPQHEASCSWETPVETTEPLIVACERLLPRVTSPLAERAHGVARLIVELSSESRQVRRLVVGLLRPALDCRHLLDLVRLRLETCRLIEPIADLRLAVLEEAPLAVEQRTLFAEVAPPIESHAWTTLVERLAGRLGNDAVAHIRPVADHQPERAWSYEPYLPPLAPVLRGEGPGVRDLRRGSRRKQLRGAPCGERSRTGGEGRPPLLLREPRNIRVVSSQPGGRPGQFRDGATDHRIVRSWGPERIETGWWRDPGIRRDYYRVETEAGTHFWLFRDLRTRGWFLHGWFD